MNFLQRRKPTPLPRWRCATQMFLCVFPDPLAYSLSQADSAAHIPIPSASNFPSPPGISPTKSQLTSPHIPTIDIIHPSPQTADRITCLPLQASIPSLTTSPFTPSTSHSSISSLADFPCHNPIASCQNPRPTVSADHNRYGWRDRGGERMNARTKEDVAAVDRSLWCREVRARICWNV